MSIENAKDDEKKITLGCERTGSDNACVRACRVKLSFRKINGNRRKCAHRTRACDKLQNFNFL